MLSTHNSRHVSSSLYQQQDTGREEEELPCRSEAPADPCTPVPPALIPRRLHWGGGGHLEGTAPSAPSPAACGAAWWKLRVLEKHQSCLQKQIKYVGIGHLTPPAWWFFLGLHFWEAVGRNTHGSWGHKTPSAPQDLARATCPKQHAWCGSCCPVGAHRAALGSPCSMAQHCHGPAELLGWGCLREWGVTRCPPAPQMLPLALGLFLHHSKA